jgi:deoxyribodipyrimidine photolyase-related protein
MRVFHRALTQRREAAGLPALGPDGLEVSSPGPSRARRWRYLPYDQLSGALGRLATDDPRTIGVVLVECPAKAARRPYHKQKLALLLANQRHFALELAARGVDVRLVVARTDSMGGPAEDFASTLRRVAGVVGPLTVMRPAEYELRHELAPLVADGLLVEQHHDGWLTTPDQFARATPGRPHGPWRMDAFYRLVRRETGILMEGRGAAAKPVGGQFSFDGDNRERWPGTPPAPPRPTFTPDAVTVEVIELVNSRFASHPGRLDPSNLPATRADAEHQLAWFVEQALPHFGPFEDAMARHERVLFHSGLSSLMNLHRLTPREVLAAVLAQASHVPLASLEGFVRQVLGWREFVHHVHEATDGFRAVGGQSVAVTEPPGPGLAGLSRINRLSMHGALPAAFWQAEPATGLHCLDTVIESVWADGYSHHITRLMVLSNVATLLDVSPRELTDWFWVAYTDAYDWVVEPNVLGMGTFAAGDLMTTKPYIAGSAYIAKMSDYCDGCALDPKRTCPLPKLYWAWLARHRDALAGNQRMAMPLASLAKRSPTQQADDAATFADWRARL